MQEELRLQPQGHAQLVLSEALGDATAHSLIPHWAEKEMMTQPLA